MKNIPIICVVHELECPSPIYYNTIPIAFDNKLWFLLRVLVTWAMLGDNIKMKQSLSGEKEEITLPRKGKYVALTAAAPRPMKKRAIPNPGFAAPTS